MSIEELKCYRNKLVIITMSSGARYSGNLAGFKPNKNLVALSKIGIHRCNGSIQHSKSESTRWFNADKIDNVRDASDGVLVDYI